MSAIGTINQEAAQEFINALFAWLCETKQQSLKEIPALEIAPEDPINEQPII
jgi:hypothetical protein